MTAPKDHSRHLDDLLHNPDKIGIEGVRYATKELLVKRPDGSTQTDIDLFYSTNLGLWIVEYKASPHLDKAIKQLRAGYQFIKKEFGEGPRALYVVSPKYLRQEIPRDLLKDSY